MQRTRCVGRGRHAGFITRRTPSVPAQTVPGVKARSATAEGGPALTPRAGLLGGAGRLPLDDHPAAPGHPVPPPVRDRRSRERTPGRSGDRRGRRTDLPGPLALGIRQHPDLAGLLNRQAS